MKPCTRCGKTIRSSPTITNIGQFHSFCFSEMKRRYVEIQHKRGKALERMRRENANTGS
jgi:superfamily I DNA/RNA helicase